MNQNYKTPKVISSLILVVFVGLFYITDQVKSQAALPNPIPNVEATPTPTPSPTPYEYRSSTPLAITRAVPNTGGASLYVSPNETIGFNLSLTD